VFLLFLDAVFQIYTQFPYSFEFTDRILVVLADHSFSSAFGTFLSDNEKERCMYSVREHTVSLWSYLNQVEILSGLLNSLYIPNNSVIWPSVAPMSIILWSSYYLRWVQDQNNYTYERRKITEIIERNKTAKAQALRLRRELQELQDEAVSLGLLSHETTERRDSENSIQT
jgi:myotubularin-related protein 9